MLLALDPSVASPGAALFFEEKLIAAGRVRIAYTDEDPGARWLRIADSIQAWAQTHGCWVIEPVQTLVYERPQIYRASKSKGDPNDLIGLAGVASAFAGICFMRFQALDLLTPTPAEWCGQIPKATRGSAKISPRAQRILSRLDASELTKVPDQHDAIDAVGLGLHALKRLGVRRVYSNGR